MKLLTPVLLILAALLSLSSASFAEQGQKLRDKLPNIHLTSQVKGCHEDMQEHCAGVTPNSDKMFMCLMAYEDQLSNPCKLGIMEAAMAVRMGAAALDYSIASCEADADKHCLNVKPVPGEYRIVNCIKAHEQEVSPGCISALKETGFWDMGAAVEPATGN